MSKWKQYTVQQTTLMGRTGWLGAWDALVSAITGKPRHVIMQPITLSFWAKAGADVSFTQVQAEIK
jgi:hypothetical protein